MQTNISQFFQHGDPAPAMVDVQAHAHAFVTTAYPRGTSTNGYVDRCTVCNSTRCPECLEAVTVVRESSRACRHYRHGHKPAEDRCTFYAGGGRESDLHLNAKFAIRSLMAPGREFTFILDCGCQAKKCDTFTVPEGSITKCESAAGRGVGDVCVTTASGELILCLEIKNTHATNTPRPCVWYELDAADVLRVAEVGGTTFTCRRFWNKNEVRLPNSVTVLL